MIVPVRPMLAAAIKDLDSLLYPLIATPKIDGIRCLTLPPVEPDGKDGLFSQQDEHCFPVTRAMKPQPNKYIRKQIATLCPPGLDGELIIPDVTFQETASFIMSFEGQPGFQYHVFDHVMTFRDPRWFKGVMEAYSKRLARLECIKLPKFCQLIPHKLIENHAELQEYEQTCVEQGYEGICLRASHSPYKFGRSTLKEHWLLKLKRFEDAEAIVIGCEELVRNKNEALVNELGYTSRQSLSSGLHGGGILGALVVRDLKTGVEFKVGSGFAVMERTDLWEQRDKLNGRVLTYKYQPHGVKDKPRAPIFKAWMPFPPPNDEIRQAGPETHDKQQQRNPALPASNG